MYLFLPKLSTMNGPRLNESLAFHSQFAITKTTISKKEINQNYGIELDIP